MIRHPMRPETVARRAVERAAKQQARDTARRERLAQMAEREGPDSIWAELLAAERHD